MLQGVFPPIPTSFAADGSLDLDALRFNIARWNDTGLAGYVVLGTNGEAALLEPEERPAVIRAVKACMAPGMQLIAGTGRESTRATIEACRQAAECGAEQTLVITPSAFKGAMTVEVLRRHYEAVADHSPLPVLLYNMPANTGVNLPPAAVSALASHPNILGVKDSSGDIGQLSALVRSTPKGFSVLCGNAGAFLPGLLLGASGGILALANVAPRETVALYRSFQDGNLREARRLHDSLMPVALAVTRSYGIGGLKAAMDLLGLAGGRPRSPLPCPEPEQVADLRHILQSANLL